MAEKQGFTGDLKYDFDISSHMEVYLSKLKKWYRVTPNDFRSFDGKRRINGEIYEGPLFQYKTNNIVPMNNTNQIIDSYELKQQKIISQRRGL